MIDFFTKQEKIIIAFLIFGLLIGAGRKLFYPKDKFLPNTKKELKTIERKIVKKSNIIDSLLVNSYINSKDQKSNKTEQKNLKKKSINLNQADFNQLILLPHIGPVIANRIIEYRKINGGFKNLNELKKIRGIGKKKFSAISKYIFVNNK